MSRLHPVSWREMEEFVLAYGCHFTRKSGDHRIYVKPGLLRPIVIRTIKDIPVSEIMSNLKTLSVSSREFLKFFGEERS